MEGWQYYNHSLIPATPPHINPDTKPIEDGSIWKREKGEGTALFVRWTTDFDCGYETEWWYCIRDNVFDLNQLKRRKRLRVSKGLNYFDIRKISPKEYAEQLYEVYAAAIKSYMVKGKINSVKKMTREAFIRQCLENDKKARCEYYGAFYQDNNELVGYMYNHVFEDYVNLLTMKLKPEYLSKDVSAALIYKTLCEYLNVQHKNYVSAGERNVRHKTNVQNYLIDNFGFRRAYCTLNIRYRTFLWVIIKLLYPFRILISKLLYNQFTINLNAFLEMERIVRSSCKHHKGCTLIKLS